MDKDYQQYCWSVKLNHEFIKKPVPFQRPRFKQAVSLLPFSLRYLKHKYKCYRDSIVPFIDFFNPVKCPQNYGVPIGGIGCGTIGRTLTGDFCRYQLSPGIYEYDTVEANMFTVCIQMNNKVKYQQALTTRRSKQKGLRAWNMAYSGEHATYYALYPESWTIYDLPGQNVKLTLHQLSPVIPHNYDDSSLPVALFNWTIENNNNEDIDLSLMFTWQSGSATDRFELSNVSSKPFEMNNYNTETAGVVINQLFRNKPLDYCIAARKNPTNGTVTYSCQFYPDDANSGEELWNDLLSDGQLNNTKCITLSREFEFYPKLRETLFYLVDENLKGPKTMKLAVAVCVKVHIKAKSKENIEFSLSWNMPKISFKNDKTVYNRFYTRYFHQNEHTAQNIASYALSKYKFWKESIKNWRKPILDDQQLPKMYKSALFNELYYISDGGTVWIDVKDDMSLHQKIREYGRFAYLEGHEYRMYNTYDVHFYASFALLKLWPKLELSLQYDFAQNVLLENNQMVEFLYDGKSHFVKSKNCVPHDLGNPDNNPWVSVNAYIGHDTKDWKDLNLKFILSLFRDYYYLKDKDFIKDMWPIIKNLMKTIEEQDLDNDGLIDSVGRPDQTYDAWCVTGASAYVGGLQVASLHSVVDIAKLLDDNESFQHYSKLYEKAKLSYNTKLWNGTYYNYDSSNTDYHDSIMADMCCGHWFLRSSGVGYEAFEKIKVKSCLETIYEFNAIKYGNGKLGCVNGMRPNGTIDITSVQSEEMWIGVTDSVAALMVYEGMHEQAWNIINGLYNLCYNELGLAFHMPEALLKDTEYRSLGYMRALGIWAIQYALDDSKH